MVTAGYSNVPRDYSGLPEVTEWLQWVTVGYSKLPSGYSGLQRLQRLQLITANDTQCQVMTANDNQ